MRSSGILMPIFSLPSSYGIGTFGKEAYRFIDFLKGAGQSYWQILPLNPTSYGDSPYQSFSSFAGNPYFIDLDFLIEDGLLEKTEAESCDFGDDLYSIDYGKLYENRLPLLKKAYKRFALNSEYDDFCHKNSFWLEDYALFMVIKKAHNDICWTEWEEAYRLRDDETISNVKKEYLEEISFYKFIQFIFYKQWDSLKKYANKNGVKIIGDIPIYVALDSADVWSNSSQFLLDKDMKPTMVAGVPPDAFTEDGQLWGNPLYNWDKMKEDKYSWWKKRIGFALEIYDTVRIDHFRGFESFFAVPARDKTAKNGKWIKGPGMDLFNSFKGEFGDNLPIIAEDLGYLTPSVRRLLKNCGFPGMKVLQFAFDIEGKSLYLPHNHIKECVVYTGTHDNDTIIGWTNTGDKKEVEFAFKYLNHKSNEGFNWTMIRSAMMSVADTCIITIQDIIGLGSEARINTPSVDSGNWRWRIDGGCINSWLAKIVFDLTSLYSRLPEDS